MSIAGGFHKAVEAASALGMQTVQIFTSTPSQWVVHPKVAATGKAGGKAAAAKTARPPRPPTWTARPIADEDAVRFRSALADRHIVRPLAHSSYLLNLASPDQQLWRRSLEGLVVELRRAHQLGIAFVVLHPGAATDADEPGGLRRIVTALNQVRRRTRRLNARVLLETTAGQGTCLGWRFEHLAAILDRVQEPDQLGVCFDTCHVFAAGYPLAPDKEYRATMRKFDRLVGLNRIRAFHLNDSQRPLGSRVDRHAHIGHGCLGLEPFQLLLNDRRFRKIPMYLETPKGQHDGQTWDEINLRTLCDLIQ